MRFLRETGRRFGKSKRAAVLGCGPAGLFAAHALETAGYHVEVFSVKRRSEMFGAQYLHRRIPGISGDPFWVTYQLRGTLEGYAEKVYGNPALANLVSPANLVGVRRAWDIRDTYYRLWDAWENRVSNVQIDPHTVNAIKAGFGLTVSSLPAPKLCLLPASHSFHSTKVWAIGDAPERRQIVRNVMWVPPGNTVICSGEPDTGWYRAATILDYSTVEWPEARKPPMSNVAEVTKPLGTNCDCFPDVVRVGRYGIWKKGVLSHTAYWDVWGKYS